MATPRRMSICATSRGSCITAESGDSFEPVKSQVLSAAMRPSTLLMSQSGAAMARRPTSQA